LGEPSDEFRRQLLAERERLLALRADTDVTIRAINAVCASFGIETPGGRRPKRPMSEHHKQAISAGKRRYHAHKNATH